MAVVIGGLPVKLFIFRQYLIVVRRILGNQLCQIFKHPVSHSLKFSARITIRIGDDIGKLIPQEQQVKFFLFLSDRRMDKFNVDPQTFHGLLIRHIVIVTGHVFCRAAAKWNPVSQGNRLTAVPVFSRFRGLRTLRPLCSFGFRFFSRCRGTCALCISACGKS